MSNGWERYKLPDINEQRKDWDRAQGAKRWEILVPVKSILHAAKTVFKFFGEKKS